MNLLSCGCSPAEHDEGELVTECRRKKATQKSISRILTCMTEPTMHPVKSSNLVAIGYQPGLEGKPGQCYVDFRNGTRYCYANVPPETFQAFLEAPSAGEFLFRVIKGTYKYHKVEPPNEPSLETL